MCGYTARLLGGFTGLGGMSQGAAAAQNAYGQGQQLQYQSGVYCGPSNGNYAEAITGRGSSVGTISAGSVLTYRGTKPVVVTLENPKENEQMQKFEVGDIVGCSWGPGRKQFINRITDVMGTDIYSYVDTTLPDATPECGVRFNDYFGATFKLIKREKTNMLETMGKDLKAFIVEHKSVIYSIALILLVDNFFFEGKFRTRVQGMVEKLLNKAEAKLENKGS